MVRNILSNVKNAVRVDGEWVGVVGKRKRETGNEWKNEPRERVRGKRELGERCSGGKALRCQKEDGSRDATLTVKM